MNQENYDYTVNEAWDNLFDKFNIAEEIEKNGYLKIAAKDIKKYKEPRLMSKWDTSKKRPEKFKANNINILPISRSSYVLGDFDVYEKLPEFTEQEENITYVEIPKLETIDINKITSEANAINVLILTKMLDHFLYTEKNYQTFNGRMGTGNFSFSIERKCKKKLLIDVESAQCEIDGGFENEESVVILEAKNIVNEDFNVRQLYYPYRLWKKKVNKPIRLVLSIYANKIFRLFEYEFVDANNMSSIKKIKDHMYSIEDINIYWEDILEVYKNTMVEMDDKYSKKGVPFIQADSMDRIISLLENLHNNPLSEKQIAEELMGFTTRQSNYYYNAGKYLGLFEKTSDRHKRIKLTSMGNFLYNLPYKERQLKIIELIFKHKIFKDLFHMIIETGYIPSKDVIEKKMINLNVCSKNLTNRRAQTVYSWLLWILKLTQLSQN
ncbi:type II restriction enzyme [Staphylococcus argenteus]|uniref:type II restriction enzyme n=1 Tax=Staphylococcus argenteus TaxID=985002 RepID=UPI000504AE6F|nr:hypothetical protein [Staphylococcus argenteus]CDR23439.1 hypothetical protein ERS140248_01863 [Staphylococcus argenteus]